MAFTRRRFITTAAATAAVVPLVPLSASSDQPKRITILRDVRKRLDFDLHQLAARAIDTARSQGADYADVRLSRVRRQMFAARPTWCSEDFGVGVRALVNGYWGFYSSAIWTPDEMARLARGAVDQAKANGVGIKRIVDLAPTPIVSGGEWAAPVKYDPFEIPLGEKMDVMGAAVDFAFSYMNGIESAFDLDFRRTEKIFASTEGSSWQQTTYLSSAGFSVAYADQYSLNLKQGRVATRKMSVSGKGWEHISESGLIQDIPKLIAQAEQTRHRTPVELGRYEAVFTPAVAAAFLNSTLGPATQLDRAMGFDAAGEGVSFLTPPLDVLGENVVASPLLTVTANRSQPGGAATVKWDDECVEPEEFTIIKQGVVNDYQTTREQASWLKPWYDKQGIPVRSHGCANSQSAQNFTSQRLPNLVITPDPNGGSLESMIAGIKRGVLVEAVNSPSPDQQLLNGVVTGTFREIVNGRLGSYIDGAGLSFRTPNLWKSLSEIGRPDTQEWYGFYRSEGQPVDTTANSVGSVPLRFKEVDIIDIMRKV